MATQSPLVSVLITTYNRSRLLRRSIDSVLMQDVPDFELIIIDDCSPDDTADVVASYKDPRIRYIRNETNVGSRAGDRAILRRFVYELMRGRYWVYLCDDDYWLLPDLLRRQVEAFERYDDVAMVMGGQLSYFLTTPDSYFGHSKDEPITFTRDNIGTYFDRTTLTSRSPHLHFMRGRRPGEPLFSRPCMTTEEFLTEFADDPAGKNIIGGATLYSREHFVRSGALGTREGSQWQAGYELKLGPACFGKTVYFDEPSIVAEIRQTNASFRGTQVEHYLDSVRSIELAFKTPLTHPELAQKRLFLRQIKKATIRALSRAYLGNTLTIIRKGNLVLCTPENIKDRVTPRHVLGACLRNGTLPAREIFFYGVEVARLRNRTSNTVIDGSELPAGLRARILRSIYVPLYVVWRRLPESVRETVKPIFRPH